MTENSASLDARSPAGPPRSVSTGHGGVSTTFQSCQNLAMGAVSVAIGLSSGELSLYLFREPYRCALTTRGRYVRVCRSCLTEFADYGSFPSALGVDGGTG
jgi:hypothetical protein